MFLSCQVMYNIFRSSVLAVSNFRLGFGTTREYSHAVRSCAMSHRRNRLGTIAIRVACIDGRVCKAVPPNSSRTVSRGTRSSDWSRRSCSAARPPIDSGTIDSVFLHVRRPLYDRYCGQFESKRFRVWALRRPAARYWSAAFMLCCKRMLIAFDISTILVNFIAI
jgi:hypothetical protein